MTELITRFEHTDFSISYTNIHTQPLTVDSVYHVVARPDYDVTRPGIPEKLILAATLSGHGLIRLKDPAIESLLPNDPVPEDHVLEQEPGDVVLFAPTHTFQYKCIGANWNFWWFEFYPSDPQIPSTLWEALSVNTVHYIPFYDTMLHLCTESLHSLKLQDAASASYLLAALLCLLNKECSKTITPKNTLALFQQAEQYIHLNLSSATVKSTAAHLNISEHTLLNIFQSLLGMRTTEYIRKAKMDMAYHLLTTGDLSIREIADQLGYADQFIFSKSFRKQFGISPHSCRKHIKVTS